MVTGLVMAIMDVQIVTSSLPQIQGELSAMADGLREVRGPRRARPAWAQKRTERLFERCSA
jgi:hypothetical protein